MPASSPAHLRVPAVVPLPATSIYRPPVCTLRQKAGSGCGATRLVTCPSTANLLLSGRPVCTFNTGCGQVLTHLDWGLFSTTQDNNPRLCGGLYYAHEHVRRPHHHANHHTTPPPTSTTGLGAGLFGPGCVRVAPAVSAPAGRAQLQPLGAHGPQHRLSRCCEVGWVGVVVWGKAVRQK